MKRTATPRKDQRVERTRAALFEALLELIVEKGYDRTTVKDVLKRADVGRATFYAHYYNKRDLLLGRMSVFQLDACVSHGQNGAAALLPDVASLFQHAADHRKLYLAMRGTEALEAALAVARADLAESFRKCFQSQKETAGGAPRNTQALIQFFTGALLQLLMWWLDEGMPETPETMGHWFQQLGEKVFNPGHRERG